MKPHITLLALLSLSLFSCHYLYKSDETKRLDAEAARIEAKYKPDTASEERMLHPKFDEQKIHGLGLFKIGTTVENSVGVLMQDKRYKLDTVVKGSDAFRMAKEFHILKVQHPSLTTDQDDVTKLTSPAAVYNWSDDVSVYTLQKYVVDSVEITDIIATFYKNVLVSFECTPSVEIRHALESKYGKAAFSSDTLTGRKTYSEKYSNGEVNAVNSSLSETFCIDIRGGLTFLTWISERAFNTQDSIEKANQSKGLKNL